MTHHIALIIIGFAVIIGCLVISFLYGRKGTKVKENENLETITLSAVKNTETQLNLAKLKYGKKPFDKEKTADFRIYKTYDGSELGVFINGIKIGDIPSDKKAFFTDNMMKITGIRDYDIKEDKKTKILSCQITVGFKK